MPYPRTRETFHCCPSGSLLSVTPLVGPRRSVPLPQDGADDMQKPSKSPEGWKWELSVEKWEGEEAPERWEREGAPEMWEGEGSTERWEGEGPTESDASVGMSHHEKSAHYHKPSVKKNVYKY
ncbi:hypothetical protein Taro_031606, partial [Colocasia esculenta]|nr:hypothetical protein [Colocasia esculenta]